MDPSYRNKKILDLSEDELNTLAFLGPNVAPGVRVMVDKVRANPTRLGCTWTRLPYKTLLALLSLPPSYYSISSNPPKLMWRSDLKTNPFPNPSPGAHFFKVPTKTAHSVFNMLLNNV
ncbi:uncharacterized protein FOMMEDRAFT_31823 [Fomitiporia mediterranea MF3/22]|uniref:uncharacterized protein n=1 Tax=Fomitiporia mediterranea (strain MF3/22) TaxID=694068 RepID=UPI0004409B70|nr:uncharacterized protein FOMMEDRAFT_31823 [Fomitiporia mediterranea MF3/22]EJC98343.1 hypothetical protein FOMMEDRAFT_31823 [Fomitiporia mediterranea MF3/22]